MVQESRVDSVGAAASFLLLGVVAGLGLDLCAKALLESYPLEQFVFLRSVAGLTIFSFFARQFGGLKSLVTSRWRWHVLRTLLASGAMFGFVNGTAE